MRKVVFIDFHGTLAYKSYSETLKEVLDRKFPDNVVNNADFRNILDGTYFWDTPHIPHTELDTTDKWWDVMLKKIENAYFELGYREESHELAMLFKREYTDPAKYQIYEDSASGLEALHKAGCTIYIASNHVPELKKIIRKTPIGKYIRHVYTSGTIGYEKPNKHFYDYILNKTKNPKHCIMIGDNILADVQGAEMAGIQAILIRNSALKAKANHYAHDMAEVVEITKQLLYVQKESLWSQIRKWW